MLDHTRFAVSSSLTAVLVFAACSPPKAPAAATDAVSATASEARLEGQILIADRWTKVVPAVLHDAKMDLATRCLLMRDDAKSKGQEIPVCYDTTRGKAARPITTIAVERDMSMAVAMQRLTASGEATHFVIDHTGGIYQVLDLAFAPRHGGAYAAGEVRVIACQEAGERALVAALQALYPDAKVTTSDASKGAEP